MAFFWWVSWGFIENFWLKTFLGIIGFRMCLFLVFFLDVVAGEGEVEICLVAFCLVLDSIFIGGSIGFRMIF